MYGVRYIPLAPSCWLSFVTSQLTEEAHRLKSPVPGQSGVDLKLRGSKLITGTSLKGEGILCTFGVLFWKLSVESSESAEVTFCSLVIRM